MGQFCLLKEPQAYGAGDWDLVADAQGRAYWLKYFAESMDRVLAAALERYGPGMRAAMGKARAGFATELARLAEKPASLPHGKLRLIDLYALREQTLRAHRLGDPFFYAKQRASRAAVEMYPGVVEWLDGLEPPERWQNLVAGVFVSQVYDPSVSAARKNGEDDGSFFQAVRDVPPRPWLVDDYDDLTGVLPINDMAAWAKVIVFLHRPGADFVLGLVPLVRALALDGVRIVLAANEQPAGQRITLDETVTLMEQLAGIDQTMSDLIAANMFEVVFTGNDMPLIDLSNVSDELNAAAEGVELVVMLGMGRDLQSNLNTPFLCDSLRLCVLTDEAVAHRMGAKRGDIICKYLPANTE